MLPPFLYSWFYLTTILNNKNIQHIAWHFKVLNSLKNYSQYIFNLPVTFYTANNSSCEVYTWLYFSWHLRVCALKGACAKLLKAWWKDHCSADYVLWASKKWIIKEFIFSRQKMVWCCQIERYDILLYFDEYWRLSLKEKLKTTDLHMSEKEINPRGKRKGKHKLKIELLKCGDDCSRYTAVN